LRRIDPRHPSFSRLHHSRFTICNCEASGEKLFVNDICLEYNNFRAVAERRTILTDPDETDLLTP
jgi:hypothetical protein